MGASEADCRVRLLCNETERKQPELLYVGDTAVS